MNELIDTLQAQHRGILLLAEHIDSALAASDTAAVQAALRAFGEALRGHFVLEDDQLYPALRRMAARYPQAGQQQVIDAFSLNMLHIRETLARFLARHWAGSTHLGVVAFEWSLIRDTLRNRLASEEQIIYRMYLDLGDAGVD